MIHQWAVGRSGSGHLQRPGPAAAVLLPGAPAPGVGVRSAEVRADRPVSEGGRSREPVREVVERTETVIRTGTRPDAGSAPSGAQPVRRLSGEPYTLPEAPSNGSRPSPSYAAK